MNCLRFILAFSYFSVDEIEMIEKIKLERWSRRCSDEWDWNQSHRRSVCLQISPFILLTPFGYGILRRINFVATIVTELARQSKTYTIVSGNSIEHIIPLCPLMTMILWLFITSREPIELDSRHSNQLMDAIVRSLYSASHHLPPTNSTSGCATK